MTVKKSGIIAAKNPDGFFGTLALMTALGLKMSETNINWVKGCHLNRVEKFEAEKDSIFVIGLGPHNCPSQALRGFLHENQEGIKIWVEAHNKGGGLKKIEGLNGHLEGIEYLGQPTDKFPSCASILEAKYPSKIEPHWTVAANHLHNPHNHLANELARTYRQVISLADQRERQGENGYVTSVFQRFLEHLHQGNDYKHFLEMLTTEKTNQELAPMPA